MAQKLALRHSTRSLLYVMLFVVYQHPTPFTRAQRDCIAENEFLVSGLESGEVSASRQVALSNVGVEILKELSEGVRITLSMSAGIYGIATGLGTHQHGILHHVLVRLVAVSDPHRVGL